MDNKNEFYPVILLIGGDSVSKDSYINEWLDKWIPAGLRSFNLNIFYGEEAVGDQVINCALSIPMLSETRGIIIREAERVNANNLEIIGQYIKNPSPSTAIILEVESIDRRQKNWQTISKLCHVAEFKVPYPEKIPAWIESRCKNYKRKIDPEASRFLFDCVGNNLGELDSELNKLDIFIEKGKKITINDIKEIIGSRAENVFKWINAIVEKNPAEALKTIENLMENEDSPVMPLTLLAKHFYSLLKIKMYQKEKMKEEEIAEKLGLNHFYYFIKLGFGKQAMRFTLQEIEEFFRYLRDADIKAKSSNIDPKLLMETLTFKICRIRPEPSLTNSAY